MRGGLTIDVYIPKGILTEPGRLTKLFWFIGGNPAVFLPLVTLAVMLPLWWFKGRDPDPGMSVAPMYDPTRASSSITKITSSTCCRSAKTGAALLRMSKSCWRTFSRETPPRRASPA